jgi:hypothetical protein
MTNTTTTITSGRRSDDAVRWIWDAIERVGWTFLQGGLSVVTVEMLDLPVWAIAPFAGVLAGLKATVARKVGNQNSASTLPISLEPIKVVTVTDQTITPAVPDGELRFTNSPN